MTLPVMTLQIYDRILPNPESGTLGILITGVCLAIILETCLRLARSYTTGWNGAAYEYGMSSEALRHILSADISKLRGYGAGEHLHRMSAIAKLRDFYNGYITTAMVDLGFVPLYLGFIIYVAGPLTSIPVTILMIFTIIALAEGQRLRKKLHHRDQADDKRYNFLIETLGGIHTLKALTLEKFFSRRYETLEEKSAQANFTTAEATAHAFNTGTVMSNIMIAAVIGGGAYFVLQGYVTAGALIATLLLSGRMMQMVQRGLVLWVKYQDYVLAREKVRSIFDVPLVRHDKPDIASATPAKGTLTVKDMTFSFQDGIPVLRNINLDLKPGNAISVTGDNASGKTTLLNLLAGIYPPTSGDVIVDGVNILCLPPGDIARHVGYMTADPVIFRGTIRDNITRFGEIDDKSARYFTSLLGIDKDVAKLPTGFDTFLQGSGSDAIPPGLKQRISMARVLAARPRVLLYDEADSTLDREGYDLVYGLLARLRESTAMIIISEDKKVASLADQHFYLHQGILKPASSPSQRVSAFTMPE